MKNLERLKFWIGLQDLKQNGYKLYILSNFIKEAFEYVSNKSHQSSNQKTSQDYL